LRRNDKQPAAKGVKRAHNDFFWVIRIQDYILIRVLKQAG
jgi:hypothetical protein